MVRSAVSDCWSSFVSCFWMDWKLIVSIRLVIIVKPIPIVVCLFIPCGIKSMRLLTSTRRSPVVCGQWLICSTTAVHVLVVVDCRIFIRAVDIISVCRLIIRDEYVFIPWVWEWSSWRSYWVFGWSLSWRFCYWFSSWIVSFLTIDLSLSRKFKAWIKCSVLASWLSGILWSYF